MCDTDDRAEVTAAEAFPASLEWKGEVLPLEPVDELSVLTVCDNVMDMLLPDEGPAKRLPLAAMARLAPPLEAPAILGGKAADVPLAQHGFSALVEIRKDGRSAGCCSTPGSRPAGAPATCAAWARIRQASRRSYAATATSTTPPGCPA